MSYVKHNFYLKILAPQKDEANWTDKASFKVLLKRGSYLLSFLTKVFLVSFQFLYLHSDFDKSRTCTQLLTSQESSSK